MVRCGGGGVPLLQSLRGRVHEATEVCWKDIGCNIGFLLDPGEMFFELGDVGVHGCVTFGQ